MNPKPFSISPYLDVVYRHRRLSAGIFAVGLTITLCVTLLLHDAYTASAMIIIEPPRIAPNFVSSERAESPRIADQLEGLTQKAFTDAWLEDLVRRLRLYQPGRRGSQQQHPGSAEQLVRDLRRQISLVVPADTIKWEEGHRHSQEGSPVMLTISFEYTDRFATERATSELAKRFMEQAQEDRNARAADATRFLQTQVAQARRKLDQKAEQKRSLEQRFAGSLPEDLRANLTELESLEGQMQIINERLTGNLLGPTGRAVAVTPEQQQLAELNLKLTHLRAEFSDEYPDVRELKTEIAHLQSQIALRAMVAPEKTPSQAADESTARLRGQAAAFNQKIQILRQNISSASEHGQAVAAVDRDYEAMSGEYHQLLDKELAAEIRQTLQKRQQDERLRLLNPVAPPRALIFPNRLATAALGVIVSLVASLVAPFGFFFTDTSFKSPEELELEYGIPVAAAIPVADEQMENRRATIQALIATCVSMLLVAGSFFAYAQWFRS
jgi:uncharacterized protein involved in exopolysaccharide biosynthesis